MLITENQEFSRYHTEYSSITKLLYILHGYQRSSTDAAFNGMSKISRTVSRHEWEISQLQALILLECQAVLPIRKHD